MTRSILALMIITLGVTTAYFGTVRADDKPATTKCEYKKCSQPWLSGGGLKNPPGEGEKPRGLYSSICQTPVNWCVIGPGAPGQSCYCNLPYGGAAWGVVTE